MNKIKLNNVEVELESYNKTTYFSEHAMNSNANCVVITNDVTALHTLAETVITSIQIKSDETIIYDLQNINGKIDNINEYLNGNRMSINIFITFQNEAVNI